MINNSIAMLRKLREFFENHLGLHAWNSVKVTHTGKTEEEEYEYVAIEFPRNGKQFCIELIPPEDAPPLGRLELRNMHSDEHVRGPLSDETFGKIHQALLAA